MDRFLDWLCGLKPILGKQFAFPPPSHRGYDPGMSKNSLQFLMAALIGAPLAILGFFLNAWLVWPTTRVGELTENGIRLLITFSMPGLVVGALIGVGIGLIVGSWIYESGPEPYPRDRRPQETRDRDLN